MGLRHHHLARLNSTSPLLSIPTVALGNPLLHHDLPSWFSQPEHSPARQRTFVLPYQSRGFRQTGVMVPLCESKHAHWCRPSPTGGKTVGHGGGPGSDGWVTLRSCQERLYTSFTPSIFQATPLVYPHRNGPTRFTPVHLHPFTVPRPLLVLCITIATRAHNFTPSPSFPSADSSTARFPKTNETRTRVHIPPHCNKSRLRPSTPLHSGNLPDSLDSAYPQ